MIMSINYLELAAVVLYFISVILTIKKNYLFWLFGMSAQFCYALLFYSKGIYANMFLQFIFISQGVYGLYKWSTSENLKTLKLTPSRRLLLTLSLMLTLFMFYLIWKNYLEGTEIRYLDVATTLMALCANTMLAWRYLESWIFWMATDILYIIFFSMEGMYFSMALYLSFLFTSVIGFRQWLKN